MKLHLRTTFLVSVITLAVMIALLLVISARLVDLIRADEKTLTGVGAVGLAEHLSQLPALPNASELERATALVRAGRGDVINVRIWEAAGNGFTAVWSTSSSATPVEMPTRVIEALRRNKVARAESGRVIQTSESLHRVFAPIVRQKKVVGAVEISDHLDNLPTLLKRSLGTVLWLALIAVGLITIATYILFRDLVYRPIENLLQVITQAKSGKLNVKAPERKPDELGRLSQAFNVMLGRIHEMTTEREQQRLNSHGWTAEAVTTPDEALRLAAQEKFDLLISDINLEANQNGIDLLRKMRDQCPVILMTGFGTLDTTVLASREGVCDIISKPFKVQEIINTVKRALERETAKPEQPVPDSLSAQYESSGLAGRSPAMLELYKEIARVAPSRSTVLIIGESGTGKELVARAIHQHSARVGRPFIPVNCGALTETLLEAELFGHLKGSFTGATADRRGLWEEAEGGTLFLDEIGETSQQMQVRLLRALQEKEIRRVGANKSIKVDARVIAATNRELEQEVAAGRFREDLFYRISVVTLRVPPLRDRRSDIPLLAERFLLSASENAGRGPLRFREETIKVLTAYDWPGNVRELESAVEYAALRARGLEIEPDDLPPKLQSENVRIRAARSPLTALFDDLPTLDEIERRYLLHVLEVVGGNRSRAAEVMGIDRRTLYRMTERFGIKDNSE